MRTLLTACMLALGLSVLAWLPAGADQLTVSQGTAPQPTANAQDGAGNEQEVKLYAEFARFADYWVQRLNKSHAEGPQNMTVVKEGDRFRARFHRIEKKSSVVRESPSRPGKYCGILRYHDTVYEAVGKTEAETRNGDFQPVPGTARAYSEIFQYKNGDWR